MAGRREQRSTGGFTLVEVIVVVAVIAILAAAAIPAAGKLLVDMEMAVADTTARQIYLAVQNRLAAMRSNSTLKKMDVSTLLPVNITMTGEDGTPKVETFRCVTEGDTGQRELLLIAGSAIDSTVLLENREHFLIVFHPETGMVQEVFYSSKDAVEPARLEELRGGSEARREDRIGYYSGGSNSKAPVIEKLERPTVRLVNQEELVVQIDLPKDVQPYDIQAVVTVSDAAAPESKTALPSLDGSRFSMVTPEADTPGGFLWRAEVVLDSLKPDAMGNSQQFKDVCSEIPPGANIEVRVRLESSGTDDGVLPSADSVATGNSLFASLEADRETVQAGYGRHLQNLHPDLSGVVSTVTKVWQTQDIYFDMAPTDADRYGQPSLWKRTYGERNFEPVYNLNLVSYSGNHYLIRGIKIYNDPKYYYVGLFSRFGDGTGDAVTITGIRLVDPQVENVRMGAGGVGAIVGRLSSATISDCSVYVEDTTHLDLYYVKGNGMVGGLVGGVEVSQINNCSVSLPLVEDAGTSRLGMRGLGGLIGYIQNPGTLVHNCYANVEHLRYSGGSDAVLSAGMLVGNGEVMVDYSYALGTIEGPRTPLNGGNLGGLCGTNARNNSRFSHSYCAVSFNMPGTQPYVFTSMPAASMVDCAYLKTVSGGALPGNVSAGGLQGLDYTQLKSWRLGDSGWAALTGEQTKPYSAALTGAYPFRGCVGNTGAGMTHYGDWPAG